MRSLVVLALATELVPRPKPLLSTASRQLDLVLDDVRLRGLSAAERQIALKALAELLLEASGVVMTEAGDDDA